MCGIAGLIRIDGMLVRREDVDRMVASIRHRGPDDEGVLVDGAIALGSTRLSILDPTPSGHMPLVDPETRVAIVHNGEVYNFKELRAELGGRFRTGTDTEVILRAYLQWGPGFVEALNGIYAFAIWDPRIRRLLVVRDRLGVKPLYLAEQSGYIAFASEIKALLALGVPARPDMDCMADYLVHGVYEHSDRTFFAGVRQVPAGHYIAIEGGLLTQRAYWSLEEAMTRQPAVGSFDDAVQGFVDLSQDALRLQLRSDVPVAVHVSGGLDSAFMLANLNAIQGGQGNIKAMSYHFGEEAYDERPAVESLMHDMNWIASFVRLDPDDVPGLASEGMYFQEQPFPGIITLAKHKLIKETVGAGAKVILEGQGGDEIGAGYQYVMGAHVLDLLRKGDAALALAETDGFAALNELTPIAAYRKVMSSMAVIWNTGWSADSSSYLRPDCRDASLIGNDRPAFERPFESELLNLLHRDLFHTKLPRILRACDRASMAYGRELRVPLLDQRLVEYVFALPNAYKIRDGVQRAFYRAALARVFPTPLSAVPKKAVADPQRDWLRGPLRQWAGDILTSRSFAERGLINPKAALAEFDAFCREAMGTGNSFHIWQWLSIDLWYRTFIDQQVPASC